LPTAGFEAGQVGAGGDLIAMPPAPRNRALSAPGILKY
jgi:hypothetical protein